MPASPKTPAQQAFDRLITDHVAPLLKRHAYRKSALTWRLRSESPPGWGVINIQKSQWGTRDDVLFYVNLGVWWDEVPPLPMTGSTRRSSPSSSTADRS